MYKRVCILPTVLEVIRKEVKLNSPTETGGALAGYLGVEDVLVITHACGPGPRAELSRTSVLIDGQNADAFCKRINKESNGRVGYVGDWHRHPGWSSLNASKQDLVAMLIIEKSNCCSVPYPVTAIYRRRPEHMVIYALSKRKLHKVPLSWVEEMPER